MTGAVTPAGDIEVLAPAGTSVAFVGEQVQVAPLVAGNLPAMIRAVRPFVGALAALQPTGDGNDIDLLQLVDLLGDHGDAVFTAISLATGVEEGRLRAAQIDQVLLLANAAIGVNRDFFTQTLAPLLASLMRPGSGAGPTPSSS